MTSGTPIACVPREFGGNRGAVVLALGSLPALSSFRHRHLDSEARQLYWGVEGHTCIFGCGPCMQTYQGMMTCHFFPKR